MSAADYDQLVNIAKCFTASGYFKDVRDVAQAMTKILAGRELGIGPMASLNGVYIERGRPCYTANIIATAIKRSGRYNFRVKVLNEKICTLVFFDGKENIGESTFTFEDADKAELTKGPNAHSWRHYPRNMLFARALTNGQKWYCSDIGNGMALYTPEELGATVDEEGGVITATEPLRLVTTPSPAEDEPPAQTSVPPPQSPHDRINEAQRKRLFALCKENGEVCHEDFKKWLGVSYRIVSTKDISKSTYDEICTSIESGEVATWCSEEREKQAEREAIQQGA